MERSQHQRRRVGGLCQVLAETQRFIGSAWMVSEDDGVFTFKLLRLCDSLCGGVENSEMEKQGRPKEVCHWSEEPRGNCFSIVPEGCEGRSLHRSRLPLRPLPAVIAQLSELEYSWKRQDFQRKFCPRSDLFV